MSQYSRVASPFDGGRYTNPGMIAAMRTFCAILGFPISQLTVEQGSFNTTVAASAGTHDKADCLDLSPTNYAEKCKVGKSIGLAIWYRTPAQGFPYHLHLVRMYSTAMAWLATAQDHAYRDHKADGLGNLTHTDTSWCPRYRGVRHLKGPTAAHYLAVRSTPGYEVAGCTPRADADLVKTTRARKYDLHNIAGVVECNSKEYFVTTSPTFYLASDFIRAWDGFVWASQDYLVDDAPAYGRVGPGLDKAKVAGAVRDRGFLIRSIGFADRDGERFVCTSHGTWYAEKSLEKVA